ncbi:SufD family Fe-S cluster assembly protein [Apilactobacillus timberlakei]|uniref:SufD family Fe-S cluster assembly protein n=3 Tax=Apilactobacillus TaxID=2767877 RepID=A0ABY2YS19_9LACO|nr:SufD family Fe-S cluster assembly protein [Apilactobacillus timberlakei]TPR12357.1 SufD family Fe-S cluster assembly protein [Apilactobacillus timberlakei]TPR12866.1 SufD family Fe-S cluster assembly protein [Apilactobacillus timberlakei]TPR14416.1 SufD family Fe-S cluster assembly protein [Apilactobacillus timberlakei]
MSLSIQEFAQKNNEPQWLSVKRMVAAKMAPNFTIDNQQRNFNFEKPILNFQKINTDNQANGIHQKDGVIMMDLFAAANQFPELIQENLMEKAIYWRDNQLNANHLAYLQSGGFVFIPDNKYIDKTINISDLVRHNDQEKHLLIIAAAGSTSNLIFEDKDTSNENDRLMIEILLGDHAKVNFYDAALSKSQNSHRVLNAYLAQNAELNTYTGLFNHFNSRYDSNIDLDGVGSSATINLINLADKQQKQLIKTKIINQSAHTSGIINERGIVADNARTVCDTTGQIKQDAPNSYSDQTNRLLTLSKESKGKIDPILLIDNHDVVAGHAASVGRVNADQLYYLKTRGIPAKEARLLLTRGFLIPLINKFPDAKIRKQMMINLEERING